MAHNLAYNCVLQFSLLCCRKDSCTANTTWLGIVHAWKTDQTKYKSFSLSTRGTWV